MEAAAEKEHFTVTDAASAEWCMEKLAEKAAAREQVETQYQKMVKRYEKWRTDSLARLNDDENYFYQLLAPWVAEQLAGSKKKSITLPCGRVGFRAGGKTFRLNGEKVVNTSPDLLQFVKQANAEFVDVKESVKWGDYKKTLQVAKDGRVVTADGEIIPGMSVEVEPAKFYAEVNPS